MSGTHALSIILYIATVLVAHKLLHSLPQILLLDEATSALDAASEAIVSQALTELATGGKPKLSTPSSPQSSNRSVSSLQAATPAGRTTIIVAHRLATITAADTIAVMSPGGKLLELGSPSQLLGRGGKGHYAQMVMQQHHATPLEAAAASLQ